MRITRTHLKTASKLWLKYRLDACLRRHEYRESLTLSLYAGEELCRGKSA